MGVELSDELVDGIFRASLPLIRTDLELDYRQIGLLIGVPAIIANVIEPILAIGADLWQRRLLVLAGGVAFAASLVVIATAPDFAVLLAGFILFFPASGTFVNITQASLMDADPERREQHMARWTVAGGVGNVVGPFIVGGMLAIGLTWRGAWMAVAALSVVAIAMMARFPFSAARTRPASFRHALVDALRQLRRIAVLRWLLLLEASDLMLDVLIAFLALYLVDIGELSPAAAAVVIGAHSVAALVGELGVVWLLERMPGLRYLRWSVVLATILYPALLMVDGTATKVAIVVGLGLVTAGWYSILQAQLYGQLPNRSGAALALKNVTGIVWSLVPIGLGALAQAQGVDRMMWVLLAGPLIILAGLRGGTVHPDHRSRR